MQAGQGILIAPEVFHAPNSVTQPFCRLSVSFFPDEAKLIPWIPEKGTFLRFSADETVQNLCAAIFAEIKKEDRLFHRELLANQISQLMLQVFRAVKETTQDSQPAVSRPKQVEDMIVIDEFFESTPPKLRTKENLAKLLHCSERQVLRKVYALYGMSFQQKQLLYRE